MDAAGTARRLDAARRQPEYALKDERQLAPITQITAEGKTKVHMVPPEVWAKLSTSTKRRTARKLKRANNLFRESKDLRDKTVSAAHWRAAAADETKPEGIDERPGAGIPTNGDPFEDPNNEI